MLYLARLKTLFQKRNLSFHLFTFTRILMRAGLALRSWCALCDSFIADDVADVQINFQGHGNVLC